VMLLAVFSTCGCGKSTVPVDDDGENLRQLAVAYSQYAGMNRGVGPGDEQALKEFIAGQSGGEFDVNAMFASTRDGQPYVVLYGRQARLPRSDVPPDLIAYEHTGVDGQRYVAFGGGAMETLDEESLAKLLPEGHTLP
jgi:hypothetical protein